MTMTNAPIMSGPVVISEEKTKTQQNGFINNDISGNTHNTEIDFFKIHMSSAASSTCIQFMLCMVDDEEEKLKEDCNLLLHKPVQSEQRKAELI